MMIHMAVNFFLAVHSFIIWTGYSQLDNLLQIRSIMLCIFFEKNKWYFSFVWIHWTQATSMCLEIIYLAKSLWNSESLFFFWKKRHYTTKSHHIKNSSNVNQKMLIKFSIKVHSEVRTFSLVGGFFFVW